MADSDIDASSDGSWFGLRKTIDEFFNYDVTPEHWRRLEVTVGHPQEHDEEYCDNGISTHKYTALTFVPKSLFEQFRRTANQYFLVINLMMLIGEFTDLYVNPIAPWSTMGMLTLMLSFTAAKEGLEDLKRHKSDKEVNRSPAVALSCDPEAKPGATETLEWRALEPGRMVLVRDREEIPADLVLLWSSEGPQAYVETMNIDGETNLKIKRPAADARGRPLFKSPEAAKNCSFAVEFEPPCGRVHTFEGTLRPSRGAEIPLDAAQFLLRGSTLRNTKAILGVVAYTGKDTRLVRNSRAVPSKLSELERVVNKMVLCILGAMVCITCISLACEVAFFSRTRKYLWYACYGVHRSGVAPLFADNCSDDLNYAPGTMWPTFFILYQNFVPISLYFTFEVINFCQAAYVDRDLEMYDEESDTPALARTSNMNSDLGMVAHVFSDKTGTLTQNVMTFKECAAGGAVYGGDDAVAGRTLEDLEKVVAGPGAARDLVEIMAVCHTVVPEALEDGSVAYQAESPDEEALVAGAKRLGLAFAARSVDSVTLNTAAGDATYEVLATIPFDSTRKRMSSLVRTPGGQVVLMCKGADSIVCGLAAEGDAGFARVPGGRQALDAALTDFSRDGLRTLVLARRDVPPEEYEAFAEAWHAAETATSDRKLRLREAAATLEKDLEVVGATAIEDKLQVGAPDTIADLARAGIKLWVLTGDKRETAINIGYSAKLLTEDMYLVCMPPDGAAPGPAGDYGVEAQLTELEALVRKASGGGDTGEFRSEALALVIEGATALEAILGNKPLERRFLWLASACKTVVACRVSPAQKRLLVRLVRRKSPSKPITLAIGDGANDVGMIQEAQIGVGISGKEGRQAVNNADFAIAQFRFLKPLLLHHGRRNYRRLSKLIIYSFFKNIVLVFVLFYWQADCAWSGTSFYNPWVYSGYNFFLGLLPFTMGFFDADTSPETVLKHPVLYAAGLRRMDLNVANMAYATLECVVASLIIYFVPRQAYLQSQGVWRADGGTEDLWVYGLCVYVGLVLAMMVRAVILVDSWNWIVAGCAVLQVAMLYTFVIFMAQTVAEDFSPPYFVDWQFFGVAYRSYSTLTFWLVSAVLVPCAVAAVQLALQLLHLEFYADVNDIGREIDHGYSDGVSLHKRDPYFAFGSFNDFMKSLLDCKRPGDSVAKDAIRDKLKTEDSAKLGVVDEGERSGFDYDHAAEATVAQD
mmetsp:Transcript_21814/g.65378  ORF Transcript_21814/g.65378 Transcript_21814/m.65378 type:complete len:1209 (-) Transcript_21814:23-3649(-)